MAVACHLSGPGGWRRHLDLRFMRSSSFVYLTGVVSVRLRCNLTIAITSMSRCDNAMPGSIATDSKGHPLLALT